MRSGFWVVAVMILSGLGCSGGRTIREVCGKMGEASCQRQQSCDPAAPALADCEKEFVLRCCAQVTCGSEPAASEDAVTVCAEDIAKAQCGKPVAGDYDSLGQYLPLSCDGIETEVGHGPH